MNEDTTYWYVRESTLEAIQSGEPVNTIMRTTVRAWKEQLDKVEPLTGTAEYTEKSVMKAQQCTPYEGDPHFKVTENELHKFADGKLSKSDFIDRPRFGNLIDMVNAGYDSYQ